MKLAKKMLACAMALAMVVVLALTAFADAPTPELVVTTTGDAVEGGTITVAVAGKNMAGLTSADLVFNYDATALKAGEVVGGTEDGAIPAAGNASEGQNTCSVMYLNGATKDATIVTMTFEVLKAGATEIEVVVESWEGTEDVNVKYENVKLNIEEKPTAADKPADDDKDPAVPETAPSIDDTGDAGVAAIAGVMAIAAVAFVATRKKDEE